VNNRISNKLKIILWCFSIIFFLLLIYGVSHYKKNHPSTDDAYVQANVIAISPQVIGLISKIYVRNNEYVQTGEPIADIDSAPFKLEVDKARAKLAIVTQQLNALEQEINTAAQKVEEKKYILNYSEKNYQRVIQLVGKGAISKDKVDQIKAELAIKNSSLLQAQGYLSELQEKAKTLNDESPVIKAAKDDLSMAQLNLQHTHITAPAAGQVINFTARPGMACNPSTSLFNLIESSEWWVKANFKETQIEKIRIGQKALIKLDMYPSLSFEGVVDSISAASEAAFSLLPPENGTGNWIKVTQRIPVKILILIPNNNNLLKVGASATVTINIKNK